MIELFADLPDDVKQTDKNFIDQIFASNSLFTAMTIIAEYAKSCLDPEEQDFIDFYFNLKMEILQNENSNDFGEKPAW